jgi:hypothetical protein
MRQTNLDTKRDIIMDFLNISHAMMPRAGVHQNVNIPVLMLQRMVVLMQLIQLPVLTDMSTVGKIGAIQTRKHV